MTPHAYEVHPRRDKHGFDLISDVLPFGRLLRQTQSAMQSGFGLLRSARA
jgi:hypothetical protein